MPVANDHQTQLGMQNNKFVTPLRLRNWHDKQLKPVFEDLRAKDSAQDVVIKDLDTSLQRYINERVNDALSKLSQAQSSLEQKITQSQNTVQGNLNATTQSLYTRMLPVGSVIMWGLVDKDFPDTFQLCDGGSFVYNGRTYKKPDLRGRFALGSGQGTDAQYPAETRTFRLNDYGGEYRHTLSISEMPKHNHETGIDVGNYSSINPNGTRDRVKRADGLDSAKATSYSGGGVAHENMPPYRALHYIIKVAD